ncbi:MAG: hypothetical protein V4649_16800 [Bacteroidota bacterium]
MRLLCSILVLLVLLSGCDKKDPDPVMPDEFVYSTQYNPIISCYAGSSMIFSFNVIVKKGSIAKNKLTCTMQGLPAGATVTPTSQVVGLLLGGVYTFNAGTLPVGDYPVQFSITSDLTGTETRSLIFRVNPLPDYAGTLAGTYIKCFDFCPPTGFTYYTSTVSAVADTPYLIRISNIKNMGADFIVRAWLSTTVKIPVQTIGDYTIWGSGTYSKDGRPGHENDYVMLVDDTLAHGLDTQRCTMHIEH